MKKRMFSVITALALCLTLLPAAAWADGADADTGETGAAAGVWDGTADTSWYDSSNPQEAYTLTTAKELAGLVGLINGGNNFSGKTITLGADIVLNEDGAASPNNRTPSQSSSPTPATAPPLSPAWPWAAKTPRPLS